MTHSNTCAALAASILFAAGCGGGDGGGGLPDGGGVPACTMQIISVLPQTPTAGATITVNSQMVKNNAPGIEVYNWAVTRDGNPVTFTPENNPDAREILFTADVAGIYQVTLMGSAGALACTDVTQMITASVSGANVETFRFRVVPGSSIPAPVHEDVISVLGGGDNYLGPISIGQGVLATGTVRAPDSSATSAYLRASDVDDIVAEGFADSDGAFALRLPFGTYDVLVVPDDGTTAPVEVSAVAAQSLADVDIPAADPVTGSVTSSGGAGIVGAVIALSVDGVPSTLDSTDGSGGFGLLVRAGSATEVSVDPPDGSSRPTLVASVGSIGANSVVDVQYAAGLSSRTFGFDVVASDGTTPLPGARVVFAARPIADAGTIRVDGGAVVSASGSARLSVTADGSGTVSSVSIPDAVYDVFVEAPEGMGEVDAWLVLDLSLGQTSPVQLALAQAGTASGKVVDDTGAAVADVVVSAVPAGALSTGLIATTTAVSAADGTFALTLSPGVDYDLVYDAGAGSGHARARSSASAPAAGTGSTLPDQALVAAVSVRGEIVVTGLPSGGAGAHVTLYCDSCSGVDAIVPVADAIANSAGEFELPVPDPGVGP